MMVIVMNKTLKIIVATLTLITVTLALTPSAIAAPLDDFKSKCKGIEGVYKKTKIDGGRTDLYYCSIDGSGVSDSIGGSTPEKALSEIKAFIENKDKYECDRTSGKEWDDASGQCKTITPTSTPASTGPGNNNCGVNTFFDWGCSGSGEQITPVLITILNWLAVGVTLAVIGGIIYGAIMYTTSGGNSQQSQKAMGIIRNAFIALVMYFAMWALLNWLVPGGLF